MQPRFTVALPHPCLRLPQVLEILKDLSGVIRIVLVASQGLSLFAVHPMYSTGFWIPTLATRHLHCDQPLDCQVSADDLARAVKRIVVGDVSCIFWRFQATPSTTIPSNSNNNNNARGGIHLDGNSSWHFQLFISASPEGPSEVVVAHLCPCPDPMPEIPVIQNGGEMFISELIRGMSTFRDLEIEQLELMIPDTNHLRLSGSSMRYGPEIVMNIACTCRNGRLIGDINVEQLFWVVSKVGRLGAFITLAVNEKNQGFAQIKLGEAGARVWFPLYCPWAPRLVTC